MADLRERLAAAERAGSRNSGNSSMPPSADDQPGREMPRKQRRAAERADRKRNRGKQPGSPGAAMRWEVPDRTEDHYPQGGCACGRDLTGAADLGVARSYQQEEIPAAPAERVQHDLHEVRCACGRPHVAARPPGVPDSALSIGPRLRALAVYLVVFQHVPGGAVPAADRRRDRRGRLGRVRPLVPAAGGISGRGGGAADPYPDHRRRGRRVRRDHAAGRAGRRQEVRPRRVHRAVLRVLAGRAQPGLDGRRRDPPGVRRDRGLRPVPELLPSQVEAYCRKPGVPGSHPARLPGLRRDLPGRRLARAGAAGTARPDPRLARRPRAGPGRHPRRRAPDRWRTSSATPSSRAWPACRACPARRTPPGSGPAASCWNSAATAADDVLRFTTDTSIWPTNDLASYCASCGGWEVQGLAGRPGGCRAGGFSVAGGSDILPWRAGAPGFAVGVAAA